jgi:UDP-3-O-[3-hydroxymyristoyl] glucosamine N-acyltransferase
MGSLWVTKEYKDKGNVRDRSFDLVAMQGWRLTKSEKATAANTHQKSNRRRSEFTASTQRARYKSEVFKHLTALVLIHETFTSQWRVETQDIIARHRSLEQAMVTTLVYTMHQN